MMNRRCAYCVNKIPVTEVATAGGITTLTVAATFNPTTCRLYCFEITAGFDSSAANNTVNLTNGTDTWTLYRKNGDYFRPYELPKLIKTVFALDPSRLIVQGMCGR